MKNFTNDSQRNNRRFNRVLVVFFVYLAVMFSYGAYQSSDTRVDNVIGALIMLILAVYFLLALSSSPAKANN